MLETYENKLVAVADAFENGEISFEEYISQVKHIVSEYKPLFASFKLPKEEKDTPNLKHQMAN